LVRGSTEPSLIRRSPQEVVQVVNGVSGKKGAIAARRLPSGDVIVTFKDTEAKEWHEKNRGWVKEAFGEAAEERKRTFTVLAKGILKKDFKNTTEEGFGRSIGLSTVERVRFRIPTREGSTRATVLVSLASQEEAKRAYEEGVL
jgi:hypothetical protein